MDHLNQQLNDEIARTIGHLTITNIGLSVQLQTAHREVEALKVAQGENERDPAKTTG